MEMVGDIITDFWMLARVAVLIFLGIYVIFSTVVVKQAKLMAETLDVEMDSFIVAVSYLHLLLAVFVFVTSIVFL